MLTKLRLKNFKSFEQAEFDLGPVTTLIGTNASGKSNVRDALRLLHGISRGYSLAEAIGEKWEHGVPIWRGIRGGTREMIFQGSNKRICELEIQFFLPEEKYASSFAKRVIRTVGATKGRYKIAIEIDNTYKPKIKCESLIIDGLDEPIYEITPELTNGKNMLTISNQKENVDETYRLDTPILYQMRNSTKIVDIMRLFYTSDVIDILSKLRFLDVSPDAMRQSSIPGQTILSDRGENLSSVLHEICENPATKRIMLEWMKELTPQDVVDFTFSEDQQGKVLLGLQEGDGRVISAYSASDGTLRFLAMIAALLSPEPARLYFFEEVENGIHPSRLHLLMQLIEQRSTTDDGQLIMSTHSPQLLSYLGERSRETASLIYRPSFSKSSHAIPILKVPHINEALQTQDVSEIHASGWFENVMEFMEKDEEAEGEA